ncbi:MAG: SAF domain-containing protein [Anaerolineae bacterium]|nr:SAF domain-containing protein [Candidatus Roseilinea sp.]MDW8448435.1 SAF domain-containing protein [Anaerolineae bacterium]
MIIVDRALQARADANNPIRVGLVGAGFMGHQITRQITKAVPGMRVVAIANRTLDHARDAYIQAGVEAGHIRQVETEGQLERAIAESKYAVTSDPTLLCKAGNVEAIVEATGQVEFGARVVLEAIRNGKHVILCNAELDGTLGPILKVYADKAGVVFTDIDGDQPAAELNLYRFVKSLGMKPLLCGNIKGLMDHYRTPATQEGFAKKWGQRAYMVTSFADGTKIAYEQAVVANATGMRVLQRGMRGFPYTGYVDEPEHIKMYDIDELRACGGAVDYALGAKPGAGIYVLAEHEDPTQHRYLDLYKMGEGPLYCFVTPFHLCYMEVPLSIARAVLFKDAAATPLAGPVVEVVATAKRDLKAGEVLDGIGYYMTYGQCENADVVRIEHLLPMGIAVGCRLKRDIAKDQVITYDDVELPPGRLCDRLREEQNARFPI